MRWNQKVCAVTMGLCLLLTQQGLPSIAQGTGANDNASVVPYADPALGGNLLTSSRTIDDIVEKYLELRQDAPTYTSYYETEPVVSAPYGAGNITDSYRKTGLERLNFYRYLLGLAPVETTDALNEDAQYGTTALAANKLPTHYPKKPSDMDDAFYQKALDATSSANVAYTVNYSGGNFLRKAMDSWMEDTDSDNIKFLGHRQYLMKPDLKYVGIGQAESEPQGNSRQNFTQCQVMDQSNPMPAYDYIAWPPVGYVPNEVFTPRMAWSVALPPSKYVIPDVNKVAVTLTRTADGVSWTLTQNDYSNDPPMEINYATGKSEVKQNFFTVPPTEGFSAGKCIVFYPHPDTVGPAYVGEYTVKITGLETTEKTPTEVNYTVNFFNIAEKLPNPPLPDGGNRAVMGRTPNEIVAKYKALNQTNPTFEKLYAENPSITNPYAAGSLTEQYLQTGLDYANFTRYLAGLPAVTLDTELNTALQHWAVVFAAGGDEWNQPSGMDNTFYEKAKSTYFTATYPEEARTDSADNHLRAGLLSLLRSSDSSSITSLGYRRLLLNPTLSKIGMGQASNDTNTFRTFHLADKAGAAVGYDYISWPPQGSFPKSMLSPNVPWSVTLNPALYNAPTRDNVTVTVKRASDGKTWTLNKDDYSDYPSGNIMRKSVWGGEVTQEFFNVDTSDFGVKNCIIFYMNAQTLVDVGANPLQTTLDGRYSVKVTGLTYKKGNSPAVLEYDVNFFDMPTNSFEENNTVYDVYGTNVSITSTTPDASGVVQIPQQVEHNSTTYTVTNIDAGAVVKEGVTAVLCFNPNIRAAEGAFAPGTTVFGYAGSDLVQQAGNYAGVKVKTLSPHKPVGDVRLDKDGNLSVLVVNGTEAETKPALMITAHMNGNTLDSYVFQEIDTLAPKSVQTITTTATASSGTPQAFFVDKTLFSSVESE